MLSESTHSCCQACSKILRAGSATEFVLFQLRNLEGISPGNNTLSSHIALLTLL